MNDYIIINDNDNVAVALRPFSKGEVIHGVTLLDDVPQAHKVALVDIKQGEDIIKYGSPIGHATKDILAGNHVHVQNTKTNLNDVFDYEYTPDFCDVKTINKEKTVDVYDRGNGEYGIRNELWIVQLVGCVSGNAHQIINAFKAQYDTSAIDGVYTFNHPFGCSQMGSDHNMTKTYLQNMVKHPNAGGVLVLGLGCENNQMKAFMETLGEYNKERVRTLVCQEVEDEVSAGVELLKELYDVMKDDVRTTHPVSVLRVGLKCGGSDGMSGITANPLLGKFSDYMALNGGTTVLGEVPEMFGAEHLLMARSKDEETFKKVVDLVNDFKIYFKNHDQVIYENPSPGNKKGGITTLEDKSLGCTQKSGSAAVKGVLSYGQVVETPGLNLLSAPGNDLVASTALAASGSHIVLFTTGRGTPFASPVPTVKISSNSPLANKKQNWIDFNSGVLVEDAEMEETAQKFFDYIIEVASGKKVCSEEAGFHDDMAIFKQGVTL